MRYFGHYQSPKISWHFAERYQILSGFKRQSMAVEHADRKTESYFPADQTA